MIKLRLLVLAVGALIWLSACGVAPDSTTNPSDTAVTQGQTSMSAATYSVVALPDATIVVADQSKNTSRTGTCDGKTFQTRHCWEGSTIGSCSCNSYNIFICSCLQ